jgi:hypothetical protein
MGKIYVKDAGTWRDTSRIYVKDTGVWRPVKNVYIKEGNAWRLAYGGSSGTNITYEPATFEGTISGTTLTVTSMRTGTIALNSYLNGYIYSSNGYSSMTLIPPGVKITAFGTGSGGVGTYTLDTSVTATNGAIMSADPEMAIFTGSISTSNVLTVTAVSQGTLYPGMVITNSTLPALAGPTTGNSSTATTVINNTVIVNQLTGTTGGTGTYTVETYFNSSGWNYTLWNTNTAGKTAVTQSIASSTFYAGMGGIVKQIVIPQGVYSASLQICGGSGGGGGSGGENNVSNYGGGGGGGANVVSGTLSVKPGEVYTVTVGSYGRPASAYSRGSGLYGGDGGYTQVSGPGGSLIAYGGQGGGHSSHHDWTASPPARGGDGGSGANAGETPASKSTIPQGGTSTNGGRRGGNGMTGMNDINPPSNSITEAQAGLPGFVKINWS